GRVPLDEAALLGCAALTGVGAVLFAARMAAGASALVVGAGGVGLFAVQGALIAGAEVVVAADPVAERRQQALALGATHAGHPDEIETLVREVAPDGVDYAFDAVGSAATAVIALALTRSHGTVVLVGIPPVGTRLDLDPALFLRREKWLTGTMYGSEDPAVALPILLDHVAAGRLVLRPLLGRSFALDDVNAAVAHSLAGAPGRAIVRPGVSSPT
ncbi:MAG: zinc-binding dehydrogenase, partial [Actinobacteria bacterium]|nr:zinc-binding dehydrogenase [Actinomycetota bacterium]